MTRTRLALMMSCAVLLTSASAHAQAAVDALLAPAPATAPTPATPPAASPRPTITIATFETDRTGWMPPPHLGDTIAELLANRIVDAGAYRVTDREWLASASQNPAQTGYDALREAATRAGVDYLVTGAVTRLSMETHKSTGLGIIPLPIIGGLIHKNKTETVIGLTLRIVDLRTGEVVATAVAESGADTSSTSGGAIGVVGKLPIAGGFGSSATGVQDGLVDRALQEAIGAAARKLVEAAPRLSGGGR